MNSQQLLKRCSNHILFRILHYAFIALQLREELAKSSTRRSCLEWRPFLLWLTHILVTYAGDIFVNLLLGILPLEPLSNVQDILVSTAAWYLIFYSPFDCAHTLARTVTFRLVASPVVAVSQVVHIERGVRLAAQMYGKNAMMPILIIGTVIGSGAELLKPVAALIIHRCQMPVQNSAYVKLSTNSKLALGIASLYLLQLQHSQLLLGISRCQLQLYALLVLVAFKYLAFCCRMDHLIWRLEHRLCYAFFGGLSADLSKFFQRRRKAFTKLA